MTQCDVTFTSLYMHLHYGQKNINKYKLIKNNNDKNMNNNTIEIQPFQHSGFSSNSVLYST